MEQTDLLARWPLGRFHASEELSVVLAFEAGGQLSYLEQARMGKEWVEGDTRPCVVTSCVCMFIEMRFVVSLAELEFLTSCLYLSARF